MLQSHLRPSIFRLISINPIWYFFSIRIHPILLEITDPIFTIIHCYMSPPFSRRAFEYHHITNLSLIISTIDFLELHQRHEMEIPLCRQDDGRAITCLKGSHGVPSTAMGGMVKCMFCQMFSRFLYVEGVGLAPNTKNTYDNCNWKEINDVFSLHSFWTVSLYNDMANELEQYCRSFGY